MAVAVHVLVTLLLWSMAVVVHVLVLLLWSMAVVAVMSLSRCFCRACMVTMARVDVLILLLRVLGIWLPRQL